MAAETSSAMRKVLFYAPSRSLRWAIAAFLTLVVTLYLLVAHDHSLANHAWNSFTSGSSSPSSYSLKAYNETETDTPELCKQSENYYTCLGTRPRRVKGAPSTKLDVVWIWANGSDPLFQDAIYDAQAAAFSSEAGSTSRVTLNKGAKLYRDHDELRYSLRSVLQHFGSQTNQFHVLTTDVGNQLGERFGILPQWLKFNTSSPAPWKDGNVTLNILHHSQVFETLDNSTFNSFSIESQLPALTSASEPFVYLNDDFFFARDLTVTDFYSSVYGVVLRLDPGLVVQPAEWPTDDPSGEWQPLKYSNWLLSERFGLRPRPYMTHVAKTLSPVILQEISTIWSEEFADTASHRFRGQRDVYTTFLHGHYLVERWREILLWSWVVGKHGRDDDIWGQTELDAAWADLGGSEASDTTQILLKPRSTLEKARVNATMADAGEVAPAATFYRFSSLDGYPYAYTYHRPRYFPMIGQGEDLYENGRAPNWTQERWAQCRISRNRCFPAGLTASEIFKHILYTQPEPCGDCIINALLNESGKLGLEAFLPPPHRIHYSSTKGRIVKDVDPDSLPRLPLIKRPEAASFKLKEVMRDWDTVRVRDWVVLAMDRYRFVIGDTPSHFGMLSNPKTANITFQRINKMADLALVTINDDVKMQANVVDKLFREFLERRWGFPSAWENVTLDG